jgi:predicted NAD/FAD-binding protein
MVRLERFVDAAGPSPGRADVRPVSGERDRRARESAGAVTPGGVVPHDRIAVVGSGVAGLSAAWHLERAGCRPVLFEAERRFGGHAHTVELSLPAPDGRRLTHGVDTGFLVYNERTYPGLIAWFDALGVETAASEMSFSVQSPGLGGSRTRLEWSGSSLDTLFAQRRNLASPRFLAMLAQVLRFNRLGTRQARDPSADGALARETVSAFLARHRFGADFRDGYLLPMIACIWSCPVERMLEFPVATLLRFCDNHGLMQVNRRPRWFTVRAGSKRYVDAVIASLSDARAGEAVQAVRRDEHGVWLDTACGPQRFAAVVLACHATQALRLLGPYAHSDERDVLGAIATQPNRAVLHTDPSVMPSARRAWAAWNFERAPHSAVPVCVHYWINRLQPLPFARDVFVSLNPCREPDASKVIARFDYEHPVFDLAALAAQARLPAIQGARRTWFAGAWCGYGFHEDGFQAGRRAAEGASNFVRGDAVAMMHDGPAAAVYAQRAVA